MSGPAAIAAPMAGASGKSRPMSTRPAARPAFHIAVAASVLAAGIGLVGAGVAWTPRRDAVQAISGGALLYAAECATCHGAQEVQRQPDVQPPFAPSLGMAGHAWRHSDAELAAIVARGIGAPPSGRAGGMPAFAGRLDNSEIEAVLAYVRSGWPSDVRAYQTALNSGGGETLTDLLRDPAWTFRGQCLPPPAAPDGR